MLSLAAARLEAGELQAAEETVTKAVADAARQRLPLGLVDALRIQGAIVGRRGASEEAESRLGRAIRLAEEITYPWGEARARFELGRVFARMGEMDRAGEELAAAGAIFEKLGAEPYRVRAAGELAAQPRR